MFAELPRYPFAGYAIESAPEDPGVYVLWEGTEITRVGLATSPNGGIKTELLDLFTKRKECPCSPTHYSWVLSGDPVTLASSLLREHSRDFVRLPRCNRS